MTEIKRLRIGEHFLHAGHYWVVTAMMAKGRVPACQITTGEVHYLPNETLVEPRELVIAERVEYCQCRSPYMEAGTGVCGDCGHRIN